VVFPNGFLGRRDGTSSTSRPEIVLCASSGGERASHRSAHWRNPRNLDREFFQAWRERHNVLC
jgi:hypothetical protein